jgi:glycosyltransferase involved in cell wall biosynthesis
MSNDCKNNINCDFYVKMYPDILNYCGANDTKHITKHYMLYGIKENRVCNEDELKKIYTNHIDQINQERTFFKNEAIFRQEEKKINILIRTSNRPDYFKKCIDSITCQKYKNYKIIVCYDDIKSYDYIAENNLELNSFYINVSSKEYYKFNLYNNYLMDKVEDGFILFLDDDDEFTHDEVLNVINNNIQSHDDVIIWKFMRPDKLIYPKSMNKISIGEIDTTMVCFNSKFKHLSQWMDCKNGDYYFYTELFRKLKDSNIDINIKFINNILTKTIFNNRINFCGK